MATEIRASSNWEIASNWSGFELRAAELLPTYDMVEGEWNVSWEFSWPSIFPASADQPALAGFRPRVLFKQRLPDGIPVGVPLVLSAVLG